MKILEGAIDDAQVKPIKIWLQKDEAYVKEHTPEPNEDDDDSDDVEPADEEG